MFSGLWDDFDSFKTCPECEKLRQDIQTARDVSMSFGQLYEEVFYDSCDERHAAWVKTFMETRRKRNAPRSPNAWMEKHETTL